MGRLLIQRRTIFDIEEPVTFGKERFQGLQRRLRQEGGARLTLSRQHATQPFAQVACPSRDVIQLITVHCIKPGGILLANGADELQPAHQANAVAQAFGGGQVRFLEAVQKIQREMAAQCERLGIGRRIGGREIASVTFKSKVYRLKKSFATGRAWRVFAGRSLCGVGNGD